jgi:poly(3-hydroxybutyrate) depolymerase
MRAPTRLLAALIAITTGCLSPVDDLAEAFAAITDPVPSSPGRHDLLFDVSSGDQGAFILYLPQDYDANAATPYPLVFLFHGGGQSADRFYDRPGMIRMRELADDQGKILVFAQGSRDGLLTTLSYWDPTGATKADRLYAGELLDHVLTSVNGDATRTFAAGFSMGGHFAHYAGVLAQPGRIAAIGVVGGFYGTNFSMPPAPAVPTSMPVFMVHGEGDNTVPVEGGPNGLTSADEAFDAWYGNNACSEPEAQSAVVDPGPPLVVLRSFRLTDCKPNGSGALQLTIVNLLGHLWPTEDQGGFDASAGMLAFFDQQ